MMRGDRRERAAHPGKGIPRVLGGPINGGVALASASGVNSLDDTGNRLFFVAFPEGVTPHLYSINTLSGAVLGSPALSGDRRRPAGTGA